MSDELRVELVEPNADAEAVDELLRGLRLELLELDVEAVTQAASGPELPGSKGSGIAVVGALLVQVRESAALLHSVVTSVLTWLRRASSSQRTVRIVVGPHSLELTAATEGQQQQLIEEFVRAVRSEGRGVGQ